MPKTTKLYTGAGDEGYTGLLGQERVPKYDLRPAAYGAVDEASTFLGLARADASASERTRQLVMAVQRDLWLLMGELAAAPGVALPRRLTADPSDPSYRRCWSRRIRSAVRSSMPFGQQKSMYDRDLAHY